jgi:hypothetical protein
MQTTYHAAKAIESHKYDAARLSAPQRRDQAKKAPRSKKDKPAWTTRPVIKPS